MFACVLGLAAPEERGRFLALPLLGSTADAARAGPLVAALRGESRATGPVIRSIERPDPRGAEMLAEAEAALRRADWSAAAAGFTRYAELARDPSAMVARFNASLVRLGQGSESVRDLLTALAEARGRSRAVAAELFWAAAELLSTERERLWHARLYLRGFAAHGGPALRMLAEVEVGRILWAQSCPVAAIDGTCGVMAPVDWPVGCHGRVRKVLQVIDRDEALAEEARGHLRAALRLGRTVTDGRAGPAQTWQIRDARASARWVLAETRFEVFLRLRRPVGVVTEVESWRDELGGALNRWEVAEQRTNHDALAPRIFTSHETKQSLFRELDSEYWQLIESASPPVVMAATFRRAQLVGEYALERGRWPERPESEVYFYCHDDVLGDLYEEESALLRFCVDVALETGHFDPWTLRCQQRRARVDPGYPELSELLGGNARSEPAAFGVVVEG